MQGLRLGAPRSTSSALLAATAGGLLAFFAFPPVGFWPAALFALVPLLWALHGARPGRGALAGAAFGLVFYGSVLYWIARFGFAAWVCLTCVCAISTALFGAGYTLVARRDRLIRNAFAAACAWVVIDWLRGMWPLGGFTWGSLGISQVDDPVLVRLAVLSGVLGVTFAVVLANGLLLAVIMGLRNEAIRHHRTPWEKMARLRAPALLLVAVLLLPAVIPFARADGRPVQVASVQVDVRRAPEAAAPEDLAVARLNIEETMQIQPGSADLVVWGEGALDPAAYEDPAVMREVIGAVKSADAPALIGAVVRKPSDGGEAESTTAVLMNSGGEVVDSYDKVHLVPFGEYVPWRERLSWFDALDQIPVDRVPGSGVRPVHVDGLPAFGTPICFENSFPSIPRQMVRRGARFLVVPVNNASYGDSAASAQHEQMSRMRAVENGRWVVGAAISGISSVIDPSGRVIGRKGLFRAGILEATIMSSSDLTIYTRVGDIGPWLALAAFGVFFIMPRGRRRSRPTPAGLPDRPRTLVILPTYNEADTVEAVVTKVLGTAENVEALVIDDGSPDGTGELVRAMIPDSGGRLKLLERPSKSGLSSAYLTGFRLAVTDSYDLVVEMDSDLSHDPSELPSLLAAAETADLVIGSRYVPGGGVTDWSKARIALSKGGNLYARLLLGIPIKDATSGYRVYRRELIEDLLAADVHADGYGFQVELAMRSWAKGYTVAESPITFRERVHGHSKISKRIIVEALWLVTVWGVQARFRRGPLLQP